MRRQRLIWFALATATAALAAVLARYLVPSPEERHPYLAVSERPFEEGEVDRIEEVASTSGQLLRDCGAEVFYIKASNGPDGVPYSLIKIVPPNDLAIHCVFERARDEGFLLHVQMLTDRQAQVY